MKISERYNILLENASEIENIICEYENKIEGQKEKLKIIEKEVKKSLPKGYWWTYDIDNTWSSPKKYSIKKVEFHWGVFNITVKESYKIPPWKSYNGEHIYNLDEFFKLKIYDTEEEAKSAYFNRTCPKCGNSMGYVNTKWCKKCMTERNRIKEEYENSHTFYEPNEKSIYKIGYIDELVPDYYRGYDGKKFIIKRLDTDEIIETNNLWGCGKNGDIKGLPLIEFITT